MYKNLREFFWDVVNGNVYQLDIENYVEKVTSNYDVDKLFQFKKALKAFFLSELALIHVVRSRYSANSDDKLDDTEANKRMRDEQMNMSPLISFVDDLAEKYLRHDLDGNVTKVKDVRFDYIFAKNGIILFEIIMENYVPFERGWQSSLSYYYWRMFEDKYIHKRPVSFIDWFENEYQKGKDDKSVINKIKTKGEVENSNRHTNYTMALYLFNQKLKNVP